MRNELTSEQISFYQENGYIAIENFIEGDELAHWQRTTQEAVDQRVAATEDEVIMAKSGGNLSDLLVGSNQKDPENYYSRVFIQCVKLADTHAGMRELMFDERLGRMAGELAGVDGIRIWHDQALFKPRTVTRLRGTSTTPYWSFSSRDSISIWVALDDATLSNGCMWYVPGSHKLADRSRNVGIGQNMAELFKTYPEWKSIDPVAAPAKAGTAVFHNGLTGHGAGANMTNKPRRAMTCAYMPDGCTYNGQANILPYDYRQSIEVGAVLNDPIINPLIWKRQA